MIEFGRAKSHPVEEVTEFASVPTGTGYRFTRIFRQSSQKQITPAGIADECWQTGTIVVSRFVNPIKSIVWTHNCQVTVGEGSQTVVWSSGKLGWPDESRFCSFVKDAHRRVYRRPQSF